MRISKDEQPSPTADPANDARRSGDGAVCCDKEGKSEDWADGHDWPPFGWSYLLAVAKRPVHSLSPLLGLWRARSKQRAFQRPLDL